jgi:hypothetical protein
MSLNGKNDNASNSTLWSVSSLKLTPNTSNRAALFGNTTANAFITGATVGQFGVDAAEVANTAKGIPHAGWVLRTEGTGGRAGRVQYETLVAMGSLGSTNTAFGTAASVPDASDDAILPP